MSLRRLGLAAPLAILVAVLMHLALFGTHHAPGAEHAPQLLTSLGAGLTLAALCAVLFAALYKRRGERKSRRLLDVGPLELLAGGALAYALIELSEGRAPLGIGVWQYSALAAAALSVFGLAALFARLLRFSGEALAAYAAVISRAYALPLIASDARRSLRARSAIARASCRGRAPPLFS